MRGIARYTGCLLAALGCAGPLLCTAEETPLPREAIAPPRPANFYLGSSVVRMHQQAEPGAVSASPMMVYSDRPLPQQPDGLQPSVDFRVNDKSTLRLRGMRSGLRLVWSNAF